MAHYVAELIQNIDQVPDRNNAQAKKNCFDAILNLWDHRAELPNGKRPYEDMEPIIRTIQSLDPDDDTPRYFRLARPPREPEKKTETDSWLKLANGLDDAAKVLIGYCLGEAARSNGDKSQEWVGLAEAAGAEETAPEIVIRFVAPGSGKKSAPSPKTVLRKKLSARLKRLESFVELAKKVCDEWHTQLETPHQRRKSRPVTKKRSATKI